MRPMRVSMLSEGDLAPKEAVAPAVAETTLGSIAAEGASGRETST